MPPKTWPFLRDLQWRRAAIKTSCIPLVPERQNDSQKREPPQYPPPFRPHRESPRESVLMDQTWQYPLASKQHKKSSPQPLRHITH